MIIKELLLPDNTGSNNENIKLKCFLHEVNPEIEQTVYPAVIIVPGGSYTHIPEHQAEILAMAYFSKGYQACILHYHFISDQMPLLPAPVIDLANGIAVLRDQSADLHVIPNKIAIAGFSVGGQVVALLNSCWQADWLLNAIEAEPSLIQPNAAILGYPVIRSGAEGFPTDPELLAQITNDPDAYAADLLVTSQNAPTFIWTTADDPVVPAQNTLFYVEALLAKNVVVEAHIYPHGPHGLALANKLTAWKEDALQPEAATWFDQSLNFLDTYL